MKAVKDLGGKVKVDAHRPGMPVVEVNFFGNTQVTDAGLKELKEFKSLRTLTHYGLQVTDAGVKELKGALPELRINP